MMPADSPGPPEGYVLLGRFGKTFQLEGGIRFRPAGDAEEAALTGLAAVFVENLGERPIKKLRLVSGQPVLYLAGVPGVESAKALVNRTVFAPRAALPAPEEGAFYLDDLVGLEVVVDGAAYGAVREVFEAGAQDVLVIIGSEGDVLVPLQAPYVTVEETRVVIDDPPEGLL